MRVSRSKLPGHLLVILFVVTLVWYVRVDASLAQSALSSGPASLKQDSQLIAEGVAALQRNDLTAARGFFEKALESNPKDPMAHTYLGILSDRSGDLLAAERHFRQAVTYDPLSPSTHNNHGASLRKLDRTREATAEFVASLQLDKNQPNALVNLAQIRAGAGTPADLTAAFDLFERAFAISPDVEVARALVVVSLKLSNREAAEKYYRAYSTGIAQTSNQIRGASARAELGAALLELDLASQAVVELTAAVAADPTNAENIVSLAKAQLATNDIPAAGRTLESAVARGVDSAAIYALLSSVYQKSGHIENAIPAMRLAIQKDPHSEKLRFTYGMLLISALAPDAAVIRLQESLELFPNSARLWLALGIAQFKSGKNDEAATCLTRSLELDPKYAAAFAYLGMTYVEIGQYEKAVQAYESALAANNKLGVVDFLLADVLLKQTIADNARVERHLVRAVQLEPAFASARLALGKLFLRTNRIPEATKEFESVIKIDANLPEAYYQLGLAYTRTKRSEEAKAAIEKFKQLSENQKEQALKDRKDITSRLANVLF
jgi:Tfp pilus assembly protein PilF